MSAKKVLSVTGLGYVGLPVAVSFANAGFKTIAFDSNPNRIAALANAVDITGSASKEELSRDNLLLTNSAEDLGSASIHIVAVPTPVTDAKTPDLTALQSALTTIGERLKKGDTVVIESTVYPGLCDEFALPILEQNAGLVCNRDFSIGYSPERINPGDGTHTFASITKIVSASNSAALEELAELYGKVVNAGIFRAPSIKAAEAAKAIENTQRDLNIALMNELSVLFHAMDLDTRDVLEAAGTKWNFLPFSPGLVGGHCIGVDPYYLTHKAHELGITPQVITAGRGTNEAMPAFIAVQIIQGCVKLARPMPPHIAVLGITYKADVPDIRNSKALDLVSELQKFGATVDVFDPLVKQAGIRLPDSVEEPEKPRAEAYDAVVLAVPHKVFLTAGDMWEAVLPLLGNGTTFVADIPAALDRKKAPEDIVLWRL
ncbi:nucleotide sugar dehydrogenase [Rhodobacteraceae bacterium RKSG542]|uniref:nucleotide sugar dehydrogenase n=1 Tax=Pseudovibrio flavus TaxID=2529854 RepID=UPI0012BBDBE4|nr:nucleotide sugar dehydrogenase [Pseudovibrio flavus]MTI17562.1 nucleotide sugar dehydrogenase [Pseudovibrio flavus]